ncbi:MAG: hypothetical protein ACRELB_04900 [Polyangiaceae bacterium]
MIDVLRDTIGLHAKPGWRLLTQISSTEVRLSVDLGIGRVLRASGSTAAEAAVRLLTQIDRATEVRPRDPAGPDDDDPEHLATLLEASIVQARDKKARPRLRLIRGGKR